MPGDPMNTRTRVGLAVLLCAVLSALTTACTIETSQDPRESKSTGGEVLRLVFSVDGSTWSEEEQRSTPAHAECTFGGDPHGGRQWYWNVGGSAPRDPKAYINSVAERLRDHGFTVGIQSSDLGKYGTLYRAVSSDKGRPTVIVTANPQTTTATVESVCVAASGGSTAEVHSLKSMTKATT